MMVTVGACASARRHLAVQDTNYLVRWPDLLPSTQKDASVDWWPPGGYAPPQDVPDGRGRHQDVSHDRHLTGDHTVKGAPGPAQSRWCRGLVDPVPSQSRGPAVHAGLECQ